MNIMKGGREEKISQRSLRAKLQRRRVKKLSEDAIPIPLDVLTVDILSKLPVKSLARFQCVSKLWSSVITDLIKTRNLTQPRLLLVFQPDLLSQCLYFSSYTYPDPNTNQTFISADKEREISCGFNCRLYQYVNGLICCLSNSKQFAIYNPTTKQSLLLPKVVYDGMTFVDGLFGYDPVENQYKVFSLVRVYNVEPEYTCQVFTLGGPKEQQWRNINIKDNFTPRCTSERSVCINGIIYYRSVRNVLGTFDVRFERFDCIQMPETLLNQSWSSITPVNYQGKLGCIHISYEKNVSAEMWIMEDHMGKQEWSKITLSITPSRLSYVAGVTRNGEIVIMSKTKWIHPYSDETLWADYYDLKKNKTITVEIKTNLVIREQYGGHGVRIFCEPDHMENTMALTSSGAPFRKKKLATTLKLLFCAASGC
ncbi:PREDICTED: putative F-box protein At1g32420 [Camelina sativa]|uniref:F-box protein At1g32420 n=1 Tax=Camelina sativa TaxID=90675 RepID=A0ABM0TUC7_CAMSA|nr:PREDICTED: putative F-box protein At1g32420 [Camelina sativa]